MGIGNDWISAAALLCSGVIYVYTIEARIGNKWRLLSTAALWLLFVAAVQRIPGAEQGVPEICVRLAGYLFLVYLLHRSKVLTWFAAAYYAIWAFLSWQLLYELYVVCARYADLVTGRAAGARPVLEIAVFVCGHVIVAFTLGRWIAEGGEKKVGPRQISWALLLFLVFQTMVFTQQDMRETPGDLWWLNRYLVQLFLALTLYLQNELFKKGDLRKELYMINLLWQKEQEHYQIAKETIAIINQKCHDLKHQIYALRGVSGQEREDYLEEIADSVQIYESLVKTGNEVLDTILTEKSLICRERGITVSCVADGGGMDFINTVDLYAIMGNAIDNAIEAVEKIESKEFRCIDVRIYRKKQFLVINVINPLEGQLVYENGLPLTTKREKNAHGFGLKSIEYMAKKYGGILRVCEEDGCFSLTVLLPLGEK